MASKEHSDIGSRDGYIEGLTGLRKALPVSLGLLPASSAYLYLGLFLEHVFPPHHDSAAPSHSLLAQQYQVREHFEYS